MTIDHPPVTYPKEQEMVSYTTQSESQNEVPLNKDNLMEAYEDEDIKNLAELLEKSKKNKLKKLDIV